MRLLDDPDLRRAVGRRGRLTVIERYGFDGVARRYRALYEELSASGPTLGVSTDASRA
jgi:glycosyltransferase involved in cell wall biosynthesis